MSEPLDPSGAGSEPFGDATDDAVSALLDDELTSFAEDHGVTEPEAMDRLTSWPGLEARSAELATARGVLRESTVDPLSELDRRRLVRTAVAASSASSEATTVDSARRRRVSRGVLAAAAAIAVVVGFGVVLSRLDTGDGSSSSSASGAKGAHAPLQGALGDVGDVTNVARLRALLDPSSKSAKPDAALGTAQPPTANQSRSATDSAAGGFASSRPAPSASAVDACATQLAGARPVRLTATGTYRGAPAVIVGIEDKGRTILFVVPPGDCTNVLTSVSR